ncbi:hypothetical protein MRX96_017325 [Rhipicephalus microplus]|uniref:BPTI/Kunitz inhibitor domain-containing protein n=1 Tax=Rhipicephalus microplus TaxID=6941 RepID=A0A9J6EH34_RHIMP|nr:hypothetical protein HPB51_013620 [Rhipicephalus microplus]
MQQFKRSVSVKGFANDGTEEQTEEVASEQSDREDSHASTNEVSSSSSGPPRSVKEATSSTPTSSCTTLHQAVSSASVASLLTRGAASNPAERSAPRFSVALVLAVIFSAVCVEAIATNHGFKLLGEASLRSDTKHHSAYTSSTAQDDGTDGQTTKSQHSSESARKAHTPRSPPPKVPLRKVRPECGAPQLTLCDEPRHEFFYHAEAGTCSMVKQADFSFCNWSPNRFASVLSCSSSCVSAVMPAQRCFDKPVFAGCSSSVIPQVKSEATA